MAEPFSPGLQSLDRAIEEVNNAAAILSPMTCIVIGAGECVKEGARVKDVVDK